MSRIGERTHPTASEQIGRFIESVAPDTLSDELVRTAGCAFLDTFASALAACNEPASRIIFDYVRSQSRNGESTIWATGERAPAEHAALANGVTARILDYDDLAPLPGRGHPSAVLLPALVSLAEAESATGGQIAAAYAVGFQILVKIPQSVVYGHHVRGWDATSTLGTIAGAAACANLLRLDAERAAAAVGIAAVHAASVRGSFGPMCRSIQSANGAASAIRCARLAAFGFGAPRDALDGPLGFMGVYGQAQDLNQSMENLEPERLDLPRLGLSVKAWPCCRSTHHAIQGILDMMAICSIPVPEIERVRVAVRREDVSTPIRKRPWRGYEAKLSIEYCVATALLDGMVRLESFTDAAVQRPEAQALLRKVEVRTEPAAMARDGALVEVELRGGPLRSAQVDTLRGSVARPLTDAEMDGKLRDCVSFSGHQFDVVGFVSAVRDWRNQPIRTTLETARTPADRS